MGLVAKEIGVSVQTLERWREDARSGRPRRAGLRARSKQSAAALVNSRAHGAANTAYSRPNGQVRLSATTALAEPEEARASPQATRRDKKRIKELERELLRKDRALAETAALLVLSKKVAAIFNKGEDE